MKSLRIYGRGARASERSQLCHLKKDFNKRLPLSPVRHSSCMADWVEPERWWRTERKGDEAHP